MTKAHSAHPIVLASGADNDARQDLGREFDAERQRRGWSIRKLASELHTSVSQVQRLLHHEIGGSLSLLTVARAVYVLDISVEIILSKHGGHAYARRTTP